MRCMRNACKALVEKSEGKERGGRWEDNIKMDLQQIGCQDVDWIGSRGGLL